MKSAVEDSQSTNAMPISGRKRLKMFSEERDGSIACCGRVGDESSKKKQKIAVDYSDPFAIPDLPGGFDCGKYGSVTKDIEDLLARMKFLKPDFAIHYNQSENEPWLPSQQVSLLPHHAVIVLDDDPITKDVAAALPVVIIDSDDEDSEVPRPSNLLQEVVTAKPNGEHHISDLLVKDGLDSSWSTKEEGALASETEVREGKDFYVAESNCLKKEEGPLSSATEVGEEKGFCVVESNCPRKEEGFLSDEMEVREEKYVADSNYSTKVEGALACKSEVKEEEGLSNCPKVEEVPLAGETGVREEKIYFAGSNCPTKAEGPLASETKIREQKGFFITEINCPEKEEGAVVSETEVREVKGYYVGVQDDEATEEAYYQTNIQDDGLGDIWKEMTIALECSKDIVEDPSSDEYASESGGDCDHSFVLKDDLGYVCRVCGVIDRGIETIFDFQYSKTKTTRTYKSESWNRESTEVFADGMKLSEHEFIATKISAHTWHRKEMKPHQVEGFNFLARNLAVDNPGGCILAHAPGSGKTFMVLSFLQSFLEKYPHARPLVVLPKGIMANWKEFQIWKVEDIPLF